MEKVIKKLKTKDASLKLVADELIKQCEKEPAFIDKILSEKKTLNECWEYVKSRASKERQDNNRCVAVAKEIVFGWAIHYFDEEELEGWKPTLEIVKDTISKITTKDKDEMVEDFDGDDEAQEIEEEPIREVKPKLKKQKGVAEGQISLFDF